MSTAGSGVSDYLADSALFDFEEPPPVTLADKFGVPPMSVLDRRGGVWQERKRRWLSLGIESELGRGSNLLGFSEALLDRTGGDGTSIFDPVVCELAYRWHTLPGDRILDPFAGGSVRGVVASTLARWYTGVDLRGEQIEANRAQAHLGSDIAPRWIEGDATDLHASLEPSDEFDLVFSCPPYADLEVYSDDPRDLSTMTYDDFSAAHGEAIRQACERLRPDRFAVWVISDVRDKKGAYRGLVSDTVRAFEAAGLRFHNDLILLDQVGNAAIRAERSFRGTRRVPRIHQHVLVMVKGDAKRATVRLETGAAS